MKTTHHVSEISILEYLTKFTGLRTSLSDFYVKSRNCKILGLYDEENTGMGFLLAQSGSITELLFITAENEDPSLKKELLDSLKGLLPSRSGLRWRIVDNPENEKFAAGYGFRDGNKLNIFRTVRADNPVAAITLKEYEKLYSAMEQRGYRTVSFDELTKEQLLQIKNNPDGEFDFTLRPEAIMDDVAGGFSGKMSFASLKDGKVAAYSIVRSPDGKKSIFEIICVAKSERGNGLFVLPFFRSCREMKDSGIESAFFAVYEDNDKMLELLNKWFPQLIASKSVQNNMILWLP